MKLVAVPVAPPLIAIVLAVCKVVAVAAFPVVLLLKVPLIRLAGIAVIGIVISAEPSNDCAVAVTPLNPILLAVVHVVAVVAFPANAPVNVVAFTLPVLGLAVILVPNRVVLVPVVVAEDKITG